MMRAIGLAFVLGLAVVWWDPAGLRWAGAAGASVGAVLVLFRFATAARRRAARRTLEGLRAMAPEAFEAEVAVWLRRDGWRVERTGGPRDGGVDLVARRGRETAFVQCKRLGEGGTVGASTVRDLYGAAVAGGATLAVLVTTGRVSPAAREWAGGLAGTPRMVVVDASLVTDVAGGRPLLG
ncbi:restriction endonuclease [Tepidiforma sp.]|uniref:restriction endonuclease n=1 Tax=Tepidiforma sp. TaxID=2682230 RepID=UPI002ADE144F|nr:restriction endonuclease [Tepidiforma sp.]